MSCLKEMSEVMVGKHGMGLSSWRVSLMCKLEWFRNLKAMMMMNG